MKQRYWLFNYSFSLPNSFGFGILNATGVKFPNKIELSKVVRNKNGGGDVVILGWSEFANKEDYEAFLAEAEEEEEK